MIQNSVREVMFLGGSNTRMHSGYVPILCDKLSTTLGKKLQVRNHSVGISACLMGIERFLTQAVEDLPDIIFIEYAINDVAIAITQDIDFWRKSYEGLLRLVTQRYPATKIYGLFFVARYSSHRVVAEGMRADMFKWAEHYPNFEMVDVDAGLVEVFDDEKRYNDDMHYASDCFEHIADIIVEHIQTLPLARSYALPKAMFDAFDSATVIELGKLPGVSSTQFANSIFDLETLILRAGETLILDIPGEIASISFISTPQSGILEISDRYGSVFIPTLHREVDRSKNPLFMNAPRLWHDWTTAQSSKTQQIRLSAHDSRSEPYCPFFSMIEPTHSETSVQLCCLLATHTWKK